MSVAEIFTIAAAIGVVTAQLSAAVVNIIIAKRTVKAVEIVSSKADVITGHVNSAAAASAAKILALEQSIVELKITLGESKERAALIAQATALKDQVKQ